MHSNYLEDIITESNLYYGNFNWGIFSIQWTFNLSLYVLGLAVFDTENKNSVNSIGTKTFMKTALLVLDYI